MKNQDNKDYDAHVPAHWRFHSLDEQPAPPRTIETGTGMGSMEEPVCKHDSPNCQHEQPNAHQPSTHLIVRAIGRMERLSKEQQNAG